MSRSGCRADRWAGHARGPGKKRAYVIVPVLIPEGVDAYEALDKSKDFEMVCQILAGVEGD